MPRGQKRIDIQEVAMEYKSSSKRHKGSISFGNLFCQKTDQNSNGFNLKKCTNWFTEYCSAEDHGVIGPEGIEKFCKDIGVDPEDVVMLVLAWKMGAQNMGYFTSQEWLRGLSDLQCDNINKLQCKLESLRSLLNDPAVFKIIYRYGFDFARDKEQRCLEIEVAKSLLSLLLSKSWLLHSSFQAYLDQSKYKVLNRDQWCNVLEFSRTIHPDLHNYDEDGAWPVLLDEYVEWLKNARAQQQWTL